MERTDTNRRGKGYALRWAMDSLLNETPQYDAFVVIDADSVASPSFLGELNGCLDGGASVVQCSDMVEPRVGSWSAEMTRVGFTLYNHARPLGRSLFGGSAGLRGNGMCFDAEVVRSHPWDAYGIAEDLEYGLELLLEGMTVTFAPRARVFATMPERSKNAESQRARWEGGRFPLIRRFAPRLLRSALSRRSFVHLDALIDLVMPPLVNLLLVAVAFALFNLLLVVAGVHRSIPLLAIWIGVIAAGFLHMFVGLYASDADLSQYRAILYLPRYVIWKVLIYARVLRARNESSWVRTTREKSHSGTK